MIETVDEALPISAGAQAGCDRDHRRPLHAGQAQAAQLAPAAGAAGGRTRRALGCRANSARRFACRAAWGKSATWISCRWRWRTPCAWGNTGPSRLAREPLGSELPKSSLILPLKQSARIARRTWGKIFIAAGVNQAAQRHLLDQPGKKIEPVRRQPGRLGQAGHERITQQLDHRLTV